MERTLRPYRFRFIVDGTRHKWVRFYRDMETALFHSKQAALREYPTAYAFSIESDQDDVEIRKSWGLD